MILKKIACLFIFALLYQFAFGISDKPDVQNPRMKNPFGISSSIGMGFSGEINLFSGTADYFILPQIDLEINFANDFDEGSYLVAGSRIFLTSSGSVKKLSPFTGILVGSITRDLFFQVPVGLNYLDETGFNTSISINKRFSYFTSKNTFIEFRIGWRF